MSVSVAITLHVCVRCNSHCCNGCDRLLVCSPSEDCIALLACVDHALFGLLIPAMNFPCLNHASVYVLRTALLLFVTFSLVSTVTPQVCVYHTNHLKAVGNLL